MMIYPKENCISESIGSNDIHNEFVDILCDLVIDALNVPYNEQRIVKPLLFKTLNEKLNSRHKDIGLLQQFENYVLDKATEDLVENLKLKSKVNYDYVVHSKLRNMTDEILKMLSKKEDITKNNNEQDINEGE